MLYINIYLFLSSLEISLFISLIHSLFLSLRLFLSVFSLSLFPFLAFHLSALSISLIIPLCFVFLPFSLSFYPLKSWLSSTLLVLLRLNEGKLQPIFLLADSIYLSQSFTLISLAIASTFFVRIGYASWW